MQERYKLSVCLSPRGMQDFPEGNPEVWAANLLYRPQMKLQEDNVLTPVCDCDSVYGGVSVPAQHRSHDWGSLSRGVSVQGCHCPGGSLSEVGLCPGEGVSLSHGTSVWGCLSVCHSFWNVFLSWHSFCRNLNENENKNAFQ